MPTSSLSIAEKVLLLSKENTAKKHKKEVLKISRSKTKEVIFYGTPTNRHAEDSNFRLAYKDGSSLRLRRDHSLQLIEKKASQ